MSVPGPAPRGTGIAPDAAPTSQTLRRASCGGSGVEGALACELATRLRTRSGPSDLGPDVAFPSLCFSLGSRGADGIPLAGLGENPIR